MTTVVDTTDKNIPHNDAIHQQALERFMDADSYEYDNRIEAIDDLNMLAGIGHWPDDVVAKREAEGRPMLVINKLPAFADQVINDSRLNRIAIKVLPNGGGATVQLAETFAGIIRNIESYSDAVTARQTALESSVNNGFGYYRITTDFADDSSFFQTIFVRRIRNPLTVYLDPAHEEADSRDIRWAFITKMVSRKEYKEILPRAKDLTPFKDANITDSTKPWISEDRVRIAEYWTKEPAGEKELYLLSDARIVDGKDWDSIVDDLKANEQWIHLEPDPNNPEVPVEVPGRAPEGSGYPETVVNPTPEIVNRRTVRTHKVMQYIMDGEKIIEETKWLGKYIPIIPVWGKEIVIDNTRYLRGLIRNAKDPQRMYNYFRTAAAETVALAPKAPYLIEEGQIENHQSEWDSLGTSNPPYLVYKHVHGVDRPRREIVTQTAIGEITECNLASDEMKATTSLFDASLGARSNETSGRAILARQREGDVANFLFHDNLKRAVKLEGDILIDLIPKVYSAERQLMTMELDGETQKPIMVNQQVRDVSTGRIVTINDLSVGRYKISITSGPSFTTQRIEAAESMLNFVQTAPDTAKFMVDLIAENMDWPGAQKIVKRFKKLLPPDIDSEGPPAPPQPTMEDIINELKAQGISLGNEIKKLKIVTDRRALENRDTQLVEAGAQGVMDLMMGGGEGNAGSTTPGQGG